MHGRFLEGRLAVVACSIALTAAMLFPALATPSDAQTSAARGEAWEAYSRASEALASCRMRGHTAPPCIAEKDAAIAAEARYRAEIGSAPMTGH